MTRVRRRSAVVGQKQLRDAAETMAGQPQSAASRHFRNHESGATSWPYPRRSRTSAPRRRSSEAAAAVL